MKTGMCEWLSNIFAAVGTILCITFLVSIAESNSTTIWKDYASMQVLSSPIEWLRWILGDMSEAQFYKSELASLGLLLGAFLAYLGFKAKKNMGFEISYRAQIFPWLILSSSLGLLFSNLFWGWTVLQTLSWQPTFVTFVSLPAATVLMYGKSFKVALFGALFGALLVSPIALLLVNYVCIPNGLPNIIGNVLGMAFGSLIGFYIFHKYPNLVQNKPKPAEHVTDIETPDQTNHHKSYGPVWTIRRMIADFSESQFFGNELASLGLIMGALLAIYLNPLSIAYGSGLIGKILISQILAAGIAVVVWRTKWVENGWYPTYIPISSVAPIAVLTFNGSYTSICLGAIIGAIIAPPLAVFISKKLPSYQHSYIGNVFSMAITSMLAIGCIHIFS